MATNIEWTEKTWNPVKGCSMVSCGCTNCYAMPMANRLAAMGNKDYQGLTHKTNKGHVWTGKVVCSEEALLLPLKWKKPTKVFVNSMSDLFHEAVPFDFILKVFGIMSVCKGHTFQILTKRPERMLEFFNWRDKNDPEFQDDPAHKAYDLCLDHGIETGCGSAFETEDLPLPNVWLGVSVENQATANERIPLLLQVPAAVRFLSMEPLLGDVDLSEPLRNAMPWDANGQKVLYNDLLHWVILGGESGSKARPMHPDWARSVRDQCKEAGVPFFFKQWGEYTVGHNTMDVPNNKRYLMFNDGEHHLWDDSLLETAYEKYRNGEKFQPTEMLKVGKKKAGRLLDGILHNEYPNTDK